MAERRLSLLRSATRFYKRAAAVFAAREVQSDPVRTTLVCKGTMAASGPTRDYAELMRENVMEGSLSTHFDVDVRRKLGS